MRYMTIKIFLIVAALTTLATASAQVQRDASVEKRVENTLSKMTLQEKLEMVGEYKGFNIHPVARLGIPAIKMTDATLGVRNYGPSTQYPATALGASTWNRDLMHDVAAQLAADCKARGVHMVLGPGLNIMRAPVGGRNFEYMSEDPYLTAQMGVSFINGLQENGVAACAKHFALNNMEQDRYSTDSRCDERTCHEIYFPAFRAAVEQAHVAAIMDSHNLVNGFHSTENSWLNQRVARKMWGFDGIIMSDWGATHSTVNAANAGLDLDMGGVDRAPHFNPDSLAAALKAGTITEGVINDKVRNILRVIYRFGWDKRPAADKSLKLDNAQSDMAALREAQEGIVLLKNQDRVLPLKRPNKVLVLGPFADANVCGGGSSRVTPIRSVSLLAGLKNTLRGTKVEVLKTDPGIVPCKDLYLDRGGYRPGLNVEYYNNQNLGGAAIVKETVPSLDFNWGKSSPNEEILGTDYFSTRYTGYLRVPASGTYTLALTSSSGSRLWLDGEMLIDNWSDHESHTETARLDLQGGRDYSIKVEYYAGTGNASLQLGYLKGSLTSNPVAQQAGQCNAVIVTAGFGQQLETEGKDRPWTLPDDQVQLIKEAAAANPNTIVVLYTGGAVDVSDWADKVKGVIWAGYPGQQGGTALAQILSGKVNPSGRLTSTWAKKWEDYAGHDYFYKKDGQDFVNYRECLMVGYRGFDKHNIEPQYPFGYGLSYTTFAFSNMKVKKSRKDYKISIDVKNVGKVAGYEVVQVYVAPQQVTDDDPVQTLRGFEKVYLNAGQKKTVTITLGEDAFSTYKVYRKAFTLNYGKYTVKVGSSSRQLPLSAEIEFKRPVKYVTVNE